jgi:hypothetical protein
MCTFEVGNHFSVAIIVWNCTTQCAINPYVYDQLVITEEPSHNLEPRPAETVGGADLPSPFGTMR